VTERDQIAELIQQLGLVRAELRRCEVQRDDTATTLRRVQAELRQALDGREREYHRAEEALEQAAALRDQLAKLSP
jgi:hypothetical protein